MRFRRTSSGELIRQTAEGSWDAASVPVLPPRATHGKPGDRKVQIGIIENDRTLREELQA